LIYVWISCWNFRRLGNDTSNIPPPSMNTIDKHFSGGFQMSLCTLIVSVLAPLSYVGRCTARGPTNRGIGSSSTGISRQAETGGWGSANIWCCAVCDLMSALIYREESPSCSYDFSIAAVHWYLVNAILMLSAKQYRVDRDSQVYR
jgi:hypothetical protein